MFRDIVAGLRCVRVLFVGYGGAGVPGEELAVNRSSSQVEEERFS
jgi:hypothetical protein